MDKKLPRLASKQLEPLLTPISEIRPHPLNYKKHPPEQIQVLRASLKAFGWTTPIRANLKGVIVAGHGMYQLSIEDGYTDIPVEKVDLDDELSKAYLIADNETARKAQNDDEQLNELLREISELPDFDIEAVGFSEEEVNSLLQDEPGEVIEDDFNPGQEVETRCKAGDLWELGRHRLLCGDSSNRDNVILLMDGKKADLFLTDPPYGVSYADKNRFLNAISPANRIQEPIKNDHGSLEDMSVLWKTVFTNAFYASKDGACYYICSPQGGELMMMMMMINESGWLLKHCLIWVKNNHVLGRSDYNYKHEPILYGWKEGAGHSYYGGASKTSVWEFDKPHKSELHPTMKPILLFSECINNATKTGEIVLDLFLGSGTTLIACEQLNRTCYGMELDPHYCDVILTRWEKFTGKTAKRLE